MLRLSLLLVLLTHSIRTAHVTDAPDIYNRLYEKLEKLNPSNKLHTDKLYDKLDRLNTLTPDSVEWSDEIEELLSVMQSWLNSDQMEGVVKDLQRMKSEAEQDYSDWNDEDTDLVEADYPMDANDDWDTEDSVENSSTSKPIVGVTPSAIIKLGPVRTVVAAAASISATNARPRIIDDPNMSLMERRQLRTSVLLSTSALVRSGKCLVPQARWLTVRQLAPAADTVYTPPCVQLHRCAPDSGCCINEGDVCAPIEGKNVVFPFYLHKADGTINVVRMQFYNHTQCSCVPRDALKNTISSRLNLNTNLDAGNQSFNDNQEDERATRRIVVRQNDWRTPTEGPELEKMDESATEPPQLRRCTCPGLFMANMTATSPCACVCDWPDATRRRDCQSLAKGKEHFGLRDRVCVARGDCTPPCCEYGAYDRTVGRCPLRRYRRMKFHGKGRYQDKVFSTSGVN